MSNNVSGVAQIVFLNEHGYYNVKVNDVWYGFGKQKPVFEKGAEINFEYEENGRFKNADVDSVEVISTDNPVADKPKKQFSGRGNSFKKDPSKDKYWDDKAAQDKLTQNEIRLQASRNAAIAVLGLALQNKLIDIPEPKGNKSKLSVLLPYIEKLTKQYYEETLAINNVGAPAVQEEKVVEKPAVQVKAATPKPAPATQPEPDFDDDINF